MLHSHTSYLVSQNEFHTFPSFFLIICLRTWISFNLIPHKAALASHSLSYKRCHQNVIPACIYSRNFIIRMLQFNPQKANQIFDSPFYIRISTHKYNKPKRTTLLQNESNFTPQTFYFCSFIHKKHKNSFHLLHKFIYQTT